MWTLYSQCYLVTIRVKIVRPDLGQGRSPTSPFLSSCAPDFTLEFYYVLVCWSLKVLLPITEMTETEIWDKDR